MAEAPKPTWAELGWKSESQRRQVREHEAENRLYDRSEGIVFVPALVVETVFVPAPVLETRRDEAAKEPAAKKAKRGRDGEGDLGAGEGEGKGGEEEDEDEGLVASILSMRCYITDSKTSRTDSYIAHESCGIVRLMCMCFF
jgi:hypothetical protein